MDIVRRYDGGIVRLDRTLQSRIAHFAVWLEDRRAAYLTGSGDRMLQDVESRWSP